MAEEKKKKTTPAAVASPSRGLSFLLGRMVLICGGIVLIGGGVLLEGQAERFLMRDPRFFLERAAEYGDPPPNLKLEGIHHSSKEQVLRVFNEDLGRSVYLLPLDSRRTALMGLPWVKNATVARLWPNQVSVKIEERTPIAYVKEPGLVDTTVIDGDGSLMEVPPGAGFNLPVVVGVGPDVEDKARQYRMHRVHRMLDEFGAEVRNVAEIDASDTDNLRVMRAIHGRAITLLLGNKEYAKRYARFMSNSEQLLARFPRALSFDLRIAEQMTVADSKPLEVEAKKPEPKKAVAPPVKEPEPVKAAKKVSKKKRG